jgi:hypothetical protein
MRHGRIFLTHTVLLQYNVQNVGAAAGMANTRLIKTKFMSLGHEKLAGTATDIPNTISDSSIAISFSM